MEPDFRALLLQRLDMIIALLQRGEARSSAQVNSSTRGSDLTVKSYADGYAKDATEDAVEQYLRGREILNDAVVGDLQKSLAALEASR